MGNKLRFLISITMIILLSLCLVTSIVKIQGAYASNEKYQNTNHALINIAGITKVSKSNDVDASLSDASNCPINATFNQSKYVRLASVGDTDVNEGTEEQFEMMKDCGVQIHIIPGNLWYDKSSNEWFSLAEDKGLKPKNTNIAVGNHDSEGQQIKKWLGENSTWNLKSFANGKVDVCTINSNSSPHSDFGFRFGSEQFTDIKNKLNQSDALYKICAIHHPFMTAKSTHPNNGAFDDYHPIFKSTGVSIVLQAHNHNYQRFQPVDDILYLVTGTGSRATGSDLSPLNSDNDGNGHKLERGKRVNGITVLDLQLDNSNEKHVKGWFISSDREILDQFEK